MNNHLQRNISIRLAELLKVKEQIESFINDNHSHNKIRINSNKGYTEYYLISPNTPPNGKYIKKNNLSIASDILQTDYYQNLLTSINQDKEVRSKSEKNIADALIRYGILHIVKIICNTR